MGKLQFYKYATLSLLLLNIFTLTFFFMTKPPHIGKEKMMRADQRLHLDRAQHDTFLDYAKEHEIAMKTIDGKQKKLLEPYFYTLVDTTQNINTLNIITEFKELEGQKIESFYSHFKDVKSILRPNQYVYYEAFVDNVFKKILGRKKKPEQPKEF